MSSPESPSITDTLTTRLNTALGGGYRIERELGGGGMSRVFVAFDEALERKIVVKVLREDVVEGISRERFRREILLSANLQHPNIVAVFAAGDAGGLPYFVMPFVDGESLRARLRHEGHLDVPNAVAILRDVARALAYAHARGVVHRDIKPDNILLAGGAAVVADFGVAKAVATARQTGHHASGELTGAGMSLGTPAYMSPEQVAGDPDTDARADIYSFGATAFEMLTGQPVFRNRSVAEQLTAHLSEPARRVSEVRSEVPAALEALVARCLEKDVRKRPQDAAELLALLDDPAMVSGELASAATPSMLLPSRRKAPVIAVLVAGVVLLGAGLFAAYRLGEDAVPPAQSIQSGSAIAILPLVSLSADSGERYIAEGVTEALTNALVALPGVRVPSRAAAAAAQRLGMGADSIASRLGVAMYMEGTVQRSGDRLRVTVRLVNAADGFTIWSDVYDRTDADILTAQTEIARGVAEAVRMEVLEIAR